MSRGERAEPGTGPVGPAGTGARWWGLGAAVLTLLVLVGVLAGALSWTAARPGAGDGMALRLHVPSVVDLTPGENRLVFGFTDRDGRLLGGGEPMDVSVSVLDVSGTEPRTLKTVRARFLASGWPDVSRASYYDNAHVLAEGFFTGTVTFPGAGRWGLEFTARQRGRGRFVQRIFPNVLSQSATPSAGAPAPRTPTPTVKGVGGDLSRLDSEPRLGDTAMHRLSLADAIRTGRPAVVLFASPGLDETRLSLPVAEILASLHREYEAQVEFIHVEVYDLERYRQKLLDGTGDATSSLEPGPAARDWGTENHPWLFFIDRRGRVVAKFFGPVARSEVEETLRRLVSEGPS